VKIKSCI
jgi:hypothetical protein